MSQPKNIPEGQSPNASSKASNGAKQRHIFRKIIAIIIALGMIALGVYFMLGCTSAQKEQATPTEETETEDGVEAVDMGLSVRWASSNVGAATGEDAGYYFAWGEVEPSDSYVWRKASTYNVMVEGATLPVARDVATTLGEGWRMPTIEEFEELIAVCEWRFKESNGSLGYEITAPNGNTIFLPAAGYIYDTTCSHSGIEGLYWCSNIAEDGDYKHATAFKLTNRDKTFETLYRYYGAQIRAVKE